MMNAFLLVAFYFLDDDLVQLDGGMANGAEHGGDIHMANQEMCHVETSTMMKNLMPLLYSRSATIARGRNDIHLLCSWL
ncbi:hypothetical protein EJB05_06237 [Eragrostis curvula]|uniref:Secreted protein n=1 Tax=Eragrostis curvula TaxID=38414 RepID=A0A5J9WFQ5_9POAL|nr:hypothetical protein EJB05_06237 [Eragrostis curvula]